MADFLVFFLGSYIYDVHPEESWGWESWNLSHVFRFYCFETIDLLLLFTNCGGIREGGDWSIFVDVINVWPLFQWEKNKKYLDDIIKLCIISFSFSLNQRGVHSSIYSQLPLFILFMWEILWNCWTLIK